MSHSLSVPQEHLIAQLITLEDDARADFLRENPALQQRAVVLYLTDEVAKLARENVDQAMRLAGVSGWLAEMLDDDYCRARSARAMGHPLLLMGKFREALESYQKALELFQVLQYELEAGITLNSSIQPLIYLGRYDDAFRRAQRARDIFKRHGDSLRLARLDANLANVLHRQDRFEDALVLYRRAKEALEVLGEPSDVAIVLNNMAVCCISLRDFESAFDAYKQVRAHSEQQHMPLLAAQADYNVANLHSLRGEYGRAIELYQETRAFCTQARDAYHCALCDLDQAEIYLDLNLLEEAKQLAQLALAGFRELKMGYEAARALTFLALASHLQGRTDEALGLFAQSRDLFVRDQNWLWPALVDLYSGFLFYHSDRAEEALGSVKAAQSVLSHSALAGKAALAELLRALLQLQLGDHTAARYWSNAALERIEHLEATGLRYLAHVVLGQVQEAQNKVAAAYQSYRRAADALRTSPSRGYADELRIPLLKNTLALYEGMIATAMRLPGEVSREATFGLVEEAKSRQFAELIGGFHTETLQVPTGDAPKSTGHVTSLRQELKSCYRQLSLAESDKQKASPDYLSRLRLRIREIEIRLLSSLDQLQANDVDSTILSGCAIPFHTIVGVLPQRGVLLEYFEVRGTFLAWVVGDGHVTIVPLASSAQVRGLLQALRKEFIEIGKEADSNRHVARAQQKTAQELLEQLYTALVAPLREHLVDGRLIVVPHSFLHYVPFQALFDGSRFLVDDFTISYSLCGSLYYLSSRQDNKLDERSLVMSVSSRQASDAIQEARTIAAALPNPRLLLDEQANDAALRTFGPCARYIHLSTQSMYRHDNPLFSTLMLGTSRLNLSGLCNMHLPCELVSLRGCGPALEELGDAGELVALIYSLHHAGAEAVLTSWWNVPEQNNAELLAHFYRQAKEGPDKAEVLRRVTIELRDRYPHPYHWAPFGLWGRSHATRRSHPDLN